MNSNKHNTDDVFDYSFQLGCETNLAPLLFHVIYNLIYLFPHYLYIIYKSILLRDISIENFLTEYILTQRTKLFTLYRY